MTRPGLARKYAQALVAVAEKKGVLARVVGEAQSLAALAASDATLAATLQSAAYPEPAKKALVLALLARLHPEGVDPITRNFVEALALHRRLSDYVVIMGALQSAVDEHDGVVRATLTTAVPLSPSEEEALKGALGRATGRTVRLETMISPALLGGAVTQVGSTIYDGSLRTSLRRLKARIAGEAPA